MEATDNYPVEPVTGQPRGCCCPSPPQTTSYDWRGPVIGTILGTILVIGWNYYRGEYDPDDNDDGEHSERDQTTASQTQAKDARSEDTEDLPPV